ncbi:MAG: ROK family protein [Pseudomonadota bacterium]
MNHAPLFGAIEGGGTKFVCAVGTSPTSLLECASVPTTNAADTLDACLRFFEVAQRNHGEIAALGFACFGPLELRPDAPEFGHMLPTPKAGWSGINIAAPLRNALGVPVALDTDVGAAAQAEWVLGAGQGEPSLVYVTVGTGIGGAMVPLVANTRLMHAEMGHVSLRRDVRDAGFVGTCPFHGDCAEGLASGPAIRARWGCDLEQLSADHHGRDLIAGYLGQLAACIALMLSPTCIVIGGGVMSDPSMLLRVRTATREWLNDYLPPLRDPAAMHGYIRAPALGSRSAIAGAMLLASAQADGTYLTR